MDSNVRIDRDHIIAITGSMTPRATRASVMRAIDSDPGLVIDKPTELELNEAITLMHRAMLDEVGKWANGIGVDVSDSPLHDEFWRVGYDAGLTGRDHIATVIGLGLLAFTEMVTRPELDLPGDVAREMTERMLCLLDRVGYHFYRGYYTSQPLGVGSFHGWRDLYAFGLLTEIASCGLLEAVTAPVGFVRQINLVIFAIPGARADQFPRTGVLRYALVNEGEGVTFFVIGRGMATALAEELAEIVPGAVIVRSWPTTSIGAYDAHSLIVENLDRITETAPAGVYNCTTDMVTMWEHSKIDGPHGWASYYFKPILDLPLNDRIAALEIWLESTPGARFDSAGSNQPTLRPPEDVEKHWDTVLALHNRVGQEPVGPERTALAKVLLTRWYAELSPA